MVISDFNFTGMKIEKLNEKHDINDFSCGDELYDKFLKQEALPHQNEKISDTYILTHNNKAIAFASVHPSGIRVNEDDRKKYSKISERKVHAHYSALNIGMLARDEKFRGNEIGKLMLLCMVILAREKPGIASYSHLTLDAKPEKVGYYESLGFKKAMHYKNRRDVPMYVKIDKIHSLIENEVGLASHIKELLNLN